MIGLQKAEILPSDRRPMLDCLAGLDMRCGDREELPLPEDRAEFVGTAVGEQHSGSDDQVLDGPGDEDLRGLRMGGDAADDINGDSADFVAGDVHFACVDSGA